MNYGNAIMFKISKTKHLKAGFRIILNKSFSSWSILLGIPGLVMSVLCFLVYLGDPQGFIYYLVTTIFTLSMFAILLSFILSIFAFKIGQNGKRKFIGMFIPAIIIAYIVLVPALSGFLLAFNE